MKLLFAVLIINYHLQFVLNISFYTCSYLNICQTGWNNVHFVNLKIPCIRELQ